MYPRVSAFSDTLEEGSTVVGGTGSLGKCLVFTLAGIQAVKLSSARYLKLLNRYLIINVLFLYPIIESNSVLIILRESKSFLLHHLYVVYP